VIAQKRAKLKAKSAPQIHYWCNYNNSTQADYYSLGGEELLFHVPRKKSCFWLMFLSSLSFSVLTDELTPQTPGLWLFAVYSSFQIIFIHWVFRGSMSTAPSSSSLLHHTTHSIASVHPLWNLPQQNSPPPGSLLLSNPSCLMAVE